MFFQDISLLFSDNPSRIYLLRKYFLAPAIRFSSMLLAFFGGIIPSSIKVLDRPIFVVGCSRSGTDIFVELFSQHPDIANWSEAAQVLDLNYYDPTGNHLKTADSLARADAIRIHSLFGAYCWLTRRKRFLNKHPQNSFRIEYLNALFPDAIFIHMIRDGRAVVLSSFQKWKNERFRHLYPLGNFPKPPQWKDYLNYPKLIQFAYQWVCLINYVRVTARNTLSPDRYFELTYEDFCQDTHAVLKRLDVACGLDPTRRAFHKIPLQLQSQNHKWRQILTEGETRAILDVIGDELKALGYAT